MIRLLCFLPCIWYLGLSAQTFQGKVIDEKGNAIPGAHALMEDRVTVTGLDGVFILETGSLSSGRLEIRALGYQTLIDSVLLPAESEKVYTLYEQSYDLEVVKMTGSWIKPGQPFTYAQLNKEQIKVMNFGRDVPYLLQNLPSTVVTSDAGTGIGYTGIRIRGSDPTRINVTLDGVPVNDAESHGVFWVDLPDLASNAGAVQVQRGVGTSTNGAGAFGATVNIKTTGLEDQAYGVAELSGGSFSTLRANARFGTGLVSDRFSLQGSLSRITSDGYIDRASSDLNSVYLSGTYLLDNQSLKVNFLRGKETTYQAWNGVPAQYIHDRELRTYNTAGMKSDGTYHDNEVDDYGQTHLHAIYHRQWNDLHLQTTLHYTHGEGYYEQFRVDESLGDYGLGDLVSSDDLIRRRWLDNDFYGVIFSLNKPAGAARSGWTIGGGANEYRGDHFGEVVWLAHQGEIAPKEYYRNDALKHDINLYGQYQYTIGNDVNLFADLQWRGVFYQFEGFSSDLMVSKENVTHHFLNPKLGIERTAGMLTTYYSVGVAHREPNRDDYIQSTPVSRPRPERLIDHELGGRYAGDRLSMALNFFWMDYKDQLVLTGAINDVGEYNRVNVAESFRLGSEYSIVWQPVSSLNLGGSLTWNRSRIRKLTEAIDDWDTGVQLLKEHRNVPISFSPEWLASGFMELTMFHTKRSEFQSRLDHRYVGSQYLDNTGDDQTSLQPYHQTDLQLTWHWYPRKLDKITLKCQIINLFDRAIISNGWVYRYISQGYDATPYDPHASRLGDGIYTLSGFYPQAGIHALFGLSVTF